MIPHAAAPPRSRCAIAGPSTATGASTTMENTAHWPVSKTSQRCLVNSTQPASSWRRMDGRSAATVRPAGSRAMSRHPAAPARTTVRQAKPIPGPKIATMAPAAAGAAMAAAEEAPPTRALAAASLARGTTSGSTAALTGPNIPSAQPYPIASASSRPSDAVPVSSVAAVAAAAVIRSASDSTSSRPRGYLSPASPPASVTASADPLWDASTSPSPAGERATWSTAKLSSKGSRPSAAPDANNPASSRRIRGSASRYCSVPRCSRFPCLPLLSCSPLPH